jgi:signal transduction histidine kinase
MSLRLRLTLLYSSFAGGILLVFGLTVYLLVTLSLLNQVDSMLERMAFRGMQMTSIDKDGDLSMRNLPTFDVTGIALVQIWNDSREQVYVSIDRLKKQPMDRAGFDKNTLIYQSVYVDNVHLRVLTVPLVFDGRQVGIMQVGASLTILDSMRYDLIYIIIAVAVVAALTVALGSWILLGRTLAPLEAIAGMVDQINRADDLSRRIPYEGERADEIGNLVESFNQTLERLESLFTSQQRFLADVSHELRTPLTVIKGNVDLIRRIKEADEESLTSIDQEAGRLTRLVGGLLMLAQAESGKLALNFAPVELDLLFTEVFTEMCILAGAKVKVHLNEIDQVLVNGDRDRLKQVLLNLTANAIQYTPPGGEIFLSMKKISDRARIIIRDTGPGIPAEDLPHIFDRFYRAEKSRMRSSSSGFGLGLSIAKWIVEHHNGHIEVESKEGAGTSFVIWLAVM